MDRRLGKQQRGGRNAPPRLASSETPYRSDRTMTPAPGRITTDPDVSAADQARFFSGAVVPEMVFLARPSVAVDDPAPDPSGRPTLIAVSDPVHWPSTVLAATADLMAARSSHPGGQWRACAEYAIGWATFTRPGAPNQGVLAAAKLHLDLRAPIEFTGSYVFFVEQSLPALSAIVNGGAFALAAGDQVDYLLAPGRTAGDFAEMLPTFDLPAAPQLASIVSLVDKDPPRP